MPRPASTGSGFITSTHVMHRKQRPSARLYGHLPPPLAERPLYRSASDQLRPVNRRCNCRPHATEQKRNGRRPTGSMGTRPGRRARYNYGGSNGRSHRTRDESIERREARSSILGWCFCENSDEDKVKRRGKTSSRDANLDVFVIYMFSVNFASQIGIPLPMLFSFILLP